MRPTTNSQHTPPQPPQRTSDAHIHPEYQQHDDANDDPPQRDDGQKHNNTLHPSVTATDANNDAETPTITVATWNIGKSKIADAMETLHIRRTYDFVALTEYLPPPNSVAEEWRGYINIMRKSRDPGARSGFAAVAMKRDTWSAADDT